MEDGEHYYSPTELEFTQAVAQVKKEVLADMGRAVSSRGDVMPASVSSFSELHDYVDANEYGGMCEDRFHWTIDAFNRLQDTIHEWLASGQALREWEAQR